MNTFQLACFLAVSDTLNFARAAQRLNVTQPAVTHQIRSLEEELNAKLFRRTTRSVELTEAGRLFLHDANGMMTIAMRAKKRFEDPAAGELCELAVAATAIPICSACMSRCGSWPRAIRTCIPGCRWCPTIFCTDFWRKSMWT